MDVHDDPDLQVRASDGQSRSFLTAPEETEEARRLYDEDTADCGYVMNLTRVWAHLPEQHVALFDLIGAASSAAGLSLRERGVLVAAMAATLGDSYCSLAWGSKLASVADPAVAAAVLTGTDHGLPAREQALARWARQVTADPNATVPSDLAGLRAAGFTDSQIAALTLFLGLRIAFSTVNDALGALPDHEFLELAPDEVRQAVTWGRPIAG